MTVGNPQNDDHLTIEYQAFSKQISSETHDNMKYGVKDVRPSKACPRSNKSQYIKKDKDGHLWQYCNDCDRKLLVS